MPDRDDHFLPTGTPTVPSQEAAPVVSTVNLAPTFANEHANFNPNTEAALSEFDDVPNDPWDNSENRHLDETFTAYVQKIVRRASYRPLMAVTGLVVGGPVTVAGWSVLFAGQTGPVILRDGVDMSSPGVVVIQSTNGVANHWYGEGPVFQRGVFVDFSQAGPVSVVTGSLYLMNDYSV